MTSPFVTGRPTRPEDLSAFYPEGAEPASGIALEKQMCRDRSAELVRDRRRQHRAAAVRRIAGAWISLLEKMRLRRPMAGRASADGRPIAVERSGKPPMNHAVKGVGNPVQMRAGIGERLRMLIIVPHGGIGFEDQHTAVPVGGEVDPEEIEIDGPGNLVQGAENPAPEMGFRVA